VVGRAVEPALRAAEGTVFPRRLLPLPHTRENNLRIVRVNLYVGRAGAVVDEENPLKCFSSVECAIEAALLVRSVGMAFYGNEDAVRIGGIDGELADLLAVADCLQVRPCFSSVGGFIDAVASGEIGPLQAFAAAYINNVRVACRNGNRTDRSGRLAVPDAVPGRARVGGLPYSSIYSTQVEGGGLAGHSCKCACAAGAHRSDFAPVHIGKKSRRNLSVRQTKTEKR